MSSPGSQFNIGSDAVLTIMAGGSPIASMLLTSFESKQLTTRLTSKPVNSSPGYREVEEGWEGTAEFDRSTSVLDDFIAAKEAARYAGQAPPVMVMTQRINNTDGTISRFRFEGVAVKLDSAGKYESDNKVSQSLSWVASRKMPA